MLLLYYMDLYNLPLTMYPLMLITQHCFQLYDNLFSSYLVAF